MKKTEKKAFKKKVVLFLALAMLLTTIMPNIALAVEGEDSELITRAATPPPNWEELEPGDPNYWPIPAGTYYSGTKIIYNGLRYNGKTSNTFKITYTVCLEALDTALDYLEIKVDVDLVPYIQKLRAKTYATTIWRDMEYMGEGVYRVKFSSVIGANLGALTQSLIDIDITLKEPHTTDNIPQKEYVVQSRVSGSRSGGRYIIAKESQGIGTVLVEAPVSNTVESTWLNKPSNIITEFNPETNILTYKWRNNPVWIYGAAVGGQKPYALNVIVDPVIVEASDSITVRADKALIPGTRYTIDKSYFETTSNPGYSTAKITYENGSVPKVDIHGAGAYIANTGALDVPIYTVIEFKIDPEKIFTDDYHHNASIKMFFTEKLNSSQKLIKNSSAENYLVLYKTFWLPEVEDAFTDDIKISGFTYHPDMFVKATLPNGTEITGRSAEEPDANGKYPFSLDIPADADLKKGDEILVQNAEYGKTLSDPVVEVVNARITFDQNYTGAPEALVVEADDNAAINTLGDKMPEEPNRENYIFAGWYDNKEGTGEEFTSETTIIKSKTVYAKWDQKLAYTVKYFISGVEDTSLEKTGFVPNSKPYIEFADIKIEIPEKNFIKVVPEVNSLGVINIPADGIIKMYYEGDVIVDPTEPTPNGYVRITFNKGENGELEGSTIFDVKIGTAMSKVPVPEIKPNIGFIKAKDPWAPALPETVTEAKEYIAQYVQLDDIIDVTDPDTPTPNGYFRVTFDKNKNGEFESGAVTMFDVKGGVEFPEAKAPKVNPNVGFELADPKWVPNLPLIITRAETIKAQYVQLDDVIVDPTPDTDDDKPDGYVTIWFKPGDNATLIGNVKYYVNPNARKTMADITVPTIKPNDGYKIANQEWNPNLVSTDTIIGDKTYTANVIAKNNAEIYEPVGQNINVKVGETPKAADGIKNKDELPAGTTYKFKDNVDTTTTGEKDATVIVVYPDGSEEEVEIKVIVTEREPSAKPVIKPVTDVDTKIVVEAPAGGEVKVNIPGITDPIIATDNGDGTYTAVLPDGTTLNPGDEINATFTEPEKNPTDADPVTVTEATFDSEKIVEMKITTPPTKVDYKVGENFEPEGMIVTLTDANGKTKEVPYAEFAENNLSVPTDKALELPDTAVTVTYEKGEKVLTDNQPITVTERNQNEIYEPIGKDIEVKKDEQPNAADGIANRDDLPEGTTYEFKEPVDTSTVGEKDAVVVVTYPDGTKDEVPVKVVVTERDQNEIYEPIGKDIEVKKDEQPNAADGIANKDDLPEGTTYEFKEPVDTSTVGEKDAVVVVTYPDGTKDEVPVKVVVTERDQNEIYEPIGKDIEVKKDEQPNAADGIANKDDLPEGTTYEFKEPVDTSTVGEKDAVVVVTYPDGTKDEVPVKVVVTEREPSAKPVDLEQVVKNNEQKIIGAFENGARPDPTTSEIIIVDVNGYPILNSNGQTIKGIINTDGTFEFPIDDLSHRQIVKVQLTEQGKDPTISDESIIIDKQGPSIENQKAEEYLDFLDITATTDDPNATFVIKVGSQEFPASVDNNGNITGRILKDIEGEITIVGTDEFGNTTVKVVNRPEINILNVRGRQPYEGQKSFIAFAQDGYNVKMQIIRGGQVVVEEEQIVDSGRALYTFVDNPLEIGDIIRIQAFYGSDSSEVVIYFVEPK